MSCGYYITSPTDTNKKRNKSRWCSTSRQNIGQNQILRNFISWKNGTFKLFRLSLEKTSESQLQEAVGDDELTRTHMTIPLWAVTAALTGISWSFSSFAFITSNTERTDEAIMKIVAETQWRPGHILLPTPNTNESVGSSRTLPFSLRKRSGLNSSGSGYISGSWRIALKISQIDIQIVSYRQTRRLTMHRLSLSILLDQFINGKSPQKANWKSIWPFGMK